MERILLLTDFSEIARNAVMYAIDMFKHRDVQFYLLNAFDADFGGSPYLMQVKEGMAEESLEGLNLELSIIQKDFPGVKIELISRFGTIVEVLLDDDPEEAINPDLIVLGCRGRGVIENFLLGSNAFDIIKNVNIPMIIVPQNAVFRPIERIVFATDFKAIDQSIAGPVLELAKMYNSELLVLNILDIEKIDKIEIERQIASFFPDIKIKFFFKDTHDVFETICSFAEINGADLVALIRHNYSFFERLFNPSITKKMVRQPHFPMVILHAR